MLVLNKIFLLSDLLCENLLKEGYEGYDSSGTQYKLTTQVSRQMFMDATQGKHHYLDPLSQLTEYQHNQLGKTSGVGDMEWVKTSLPAFLQSLGGYISQRTSTLNTILLKMRYMLPMTQFACMYYFTPSVI